MVNIGLLLLVVLFGSLNSVSVKIALQSFSPMLFTFFRFLIAFVIILPFLKQYRFFDFKKSKKLYLISTFAVLNVILFAFGIRLTTIIASSIIATTIPIIVGIFTHFYLGKRYRRNEVVGAVLGLIGTMYVVLLPVISGKVNVGGSLLGNILIFGGIIPFAMYGVLTKSIHNDFSKKEITVALFLLAWTSHLLFIGVELINSRPLFIAEVTTKTLVALLFSASLGTVAFYLLYQRLIARAGPLFASFFLYLSPLFSTIAAVILIGEKPTPNLMAGAALTFLGVWLYGRK